MLLIIFVLNILLNNELKIMYLMFIGPCIIVITEE